MPPTLKTGLPTDIVSIASDFNGSRHAIDSSGKVWSWGFNFYGQLADGTRIDNQTPRVIQDLPQISKISAGTESILALDVNGDVWGWGRNYEGQTGQPGSVFEGVPKKVTGLPPIKEVLSGGNSSKAVDFNQKVWEWGANRTGGQSNVPTNITSPANINLFMLADSGTMRSNGINTIAKRDLIVQAELSITQTAPVTSVVGGQNVTYTINYQNTSTVVATGIQITDDLLPDLTFVSCSNSCVNTGQKVTWTLPDIPAGDTGTVTLDATVSTSVATGKLSNTALISSANAESNSAVLSLDVAGPAVPALSLSKTASQSSVSEYSNFNYTLSYSNTLPSSIDNVVITDTLDSRLTISSMPAECTSSGQDISCSLGTLASGATGLLDIYVNVIPGAAAGPLSNTAIISSDQTDSKAVGNLITVNPPNINNPNQAQELYFEKSVNTSNTYYGNTLYYSIRVENPNDEQVNVRIKDVLDPRLSYNYDCNFSCYTSSSNINTALEWDFTISSNSTEYIDYSVYVNSNAAPGDLWNTAILEYYSNSIYNGSKSSSVRTYINDSGQGFDPVSTPSTAFTINKTASVAQASPGDTFDYTITAASQGFDGSIDFSDTLDSRLNLINCNSCSQNGQVLTFNDYLNYFNTNTYTITVQVKTPAAAGPLANTVFATRQSVGNGSDPETKAATAMVQITSSQAVTNLQISKTSSKTIVQRGDSYNYTINYANIGNTNVTNAVLNDFLDSRLNFVSCTNSCTQSGQNLTWNLGSLAANAVGSVTISVTVKNTAAPGILANTAQLVSDQTAPIAAITYVRVEQPTPTTVINLTKTANKTNVSAGEQIIYNLNYTNSGNVDLTGGIITDVLDSKLDFVSCSSSCTQNGQTITWNLGSVTANTDTNVTVTVAVKNNAPTGLLPNTATFKTNETPQVTSSANVNIGSVSYLPIVISKTASQPNVSPNTTYTYTINYQNPNNLPLTNTVLTDVLDTRLDFVSCSNTCTQAGQNLSWNIGNLAANATGSVIITVKVKNAAASGTLNNTALVQSTETTQSSGSIQVTVDAAAALQPLVITKSASLNDVNRNTTFTYTINYQNPNNAPVTATSLTDLLDARLDFVSCSNTCTQAGQNLSWNIGNLAANATGSVTISVKVKNTAAYGLLANTAIIDSAETTGASASSFVSISPISSIAAPTLTKSQDKTQLNRGDSLVYTINYSNNSDVNFSNAIITDVLNSNLSFVSCSNSCTQTGQNLSWNIGALAIGASGSMTVNVTVKTNATLGLLQNTASISTTEAPTIQAFSFGSIIINDPILTPTLNISKSASVSTANRGNTFNYSLDYTNGPTAVTNAIVSDTLDSRLTFLSCSNSCTQSGQIITWNLGNLAANATGNLALNVAVKDDAAIGGLDNIAFVDSSETVASSSNKSTVAIVIPDNPTLTISKSTGSTSAAPGDDITYTINYSNTANLPVTNVVITDILNANLSFVSCSNSCTQSGQTITWNIGNLALNASGTVTVTAKISNSSPIGLLANSANITSTQTSSSTSSVAISVNNPTAANISLLKSASSSTLRRGNTLDYTISYANSSVPVTNTLITDTLDSRLTFVFCSNSCTQSGQNISWNLGNLAANASGSVTITVSVKSNATLGNLKNTATIDSTETSPKSAEVSVAIIIDDLVLVPALVITKSSSVSTALRGDVYTYTINYTNGPTSVTNTLITDTLDSRLTFISCSNSCTQSGQTITWNIGNLVPGDTGTVSLVVSVKDDAAVGGLNNISTIDADETTPINSNNTTVAIVTPDNPTLSLTKSANSNTVAPGDNITYTLNYSNTANKPVTNVSITDILNSNLSFVSCSNSCTQSGQTITWNIGNLALNASGTVTLVAKISNLATNGLINNSASIISNQTSVNSSTVGVGIVTPPQASINISKSSSVSTLHRGDTFTYTISYLNSNVPVTNARITDTLDPRLAFVSCAGCTRSGQNLTWNLGNLAANASGSVTVTVELSNNASLGSLNNTATVSSDQTSPKSAQTSVAVIIDDPTPTLGLLALISPDTINPGQDTTFTINFINSNSSPVTNAKLETTLNPNLILQSACTGTCTQVGQALTWNLGNLNAGAIGSVIFSVKAANTTPGGLISNQFTITSTETAANSSSVALAVIPIVPVIAPSLAITKTSSSPSYAPSNDVSYIIAYSNPSNTDATNLSITDVLNSNLSFVSCTGGCIQSGQTITWSIPSLLKNSSGSFTIIAKIKPNTIINLIQNTATIASTGFNPASSTASIAVVTPNTGGVKLVQNQTVTGTNLNVAKTADKKVAQSGEKIVFTIQYSNDGPSTVKNVVVEDLLSKYLEFVNCSQNCQVSGQNLSWNIPSLESGQKGTIVIEAKVKALPTVLGVNSTQGNIDIAPKFTVDQSESKATIRGDGTIQESSTSAVAVFDLTAGAKVASKTVEIPTNNQILVRTGAVQSAGSYITYLIIEMMLFGFVYMSLKEKKSDN